jgi:hypothetical protein
MTLQTDEHLLRCAETPSVEPSRLVTTWRPLAGLEGLWHAAREVSGVPLRSVALRLADGRLAIYSPVRGLGHEAHLELTKIGPPVPVFVSAPVSDGSSGTASVTDVGSSRRCSTSNRRSWFLVTAIFS